MPDVGRPEDLVNWSAIPNETDCWMRPNDQAQWHLVHKMPNQTCRRYVFERKTNRMALHSRPEKVKGRQCSLENPDTTVQVYHREVARLQAELNEQGAVGAVPVAVSPFLPADGEYVVSPSTFRLYVSEEDVSEPQDDGKAGQIPEAVVTLFLIMCDG